MSIPVIDIFAGPGGLGEGFSSFQLDNNRIFNTVLSIEMDDYAHDTLTLRSFYRQFKKGEAPEDYYKVLRKNLTVEELFDNWPEEAELAKKEAWKAKLGYDEDSETTEEVDRRIKEALPSNNQEWVLIGGPPCQAYSVVGRSRRREKVLDAEKDERVDLYKQYLRILEKHQPAVFVMENVKGMLSARSKSDYIFERIMRDLNEAGYRIYSLVKKHKENLEEKPKFEPEDYIIRCEEYGVPQTRHRVILLGIREDFYKEPPETLEKKEPVSIKQVIDDLPRLRSALSRKKNTWENWNQIVSKVALNGVMEALDSEVAAKVKKNIKKLRKPQKASGDEFVKSRKNAPSVQYEKDWYIDDQIGGACNHESRGHMGSDLHRYMFSSTFGKIKKRSPKLEDFPECLLPNHKNVKDAIKNKKFTDRFRVQLEAEPAKTVTSHISKDGHYYIHYDPSQCRSLTVREAARVQTFPDNYFFCGPRTSQYIQVGNAVPPFLAKQIASIIFEIFHNQ